MNTPQHKPALASQPIALGRRAWPLVLALILVAVNLRPALSSLAPILSRVQDALGLSASSAGLLTTLPVLCLGLFAPLAPRLARRFSAEQTVLAVLLMLGGGVALRGVFGAPGLFLGTLLAGASIGIIGVLLPGIIKREFPRQAAVMTGVYTMALCLGAAVAAGATVPLADNLPGQWRSALALWALPAIVALGAWLPYRHLARVSPPVAQAPGTGLWRDPVAWQVTALMGLQSSLAYCVFGWLPSILQGRGISALDSGLLMSGSVMLQVVASLAAPALSGYFHDQRPMIGLMILCVSVGLMGALYAPVAGMWWWMIILGIGQGGAFAMALTLLVVRTPTPALAAQLSGMAQGLGYTLASLGPLLVGIIHEATGSWAALGILFGVICSAAFAFGMLAGRNRLVLDGRGRG